VSYAIGARTLAEHPELAYLFNPGLPPRPPTEQEQAAYGHRYDYPDWAWARPGRPAGEAGPDDTAVIPACDALTETIPEVTG
jgi:hypothetical protein